MNYEYFEKKTSQKNVCNNLALHQDLFLRVYRPHFSRKRQDSLNARFFFSVLRGGKDHNHPQGEGNFVIKNSMSRSRRVQNPNKPKLSTRIRLAEDAKTTQLIPPRQSLILADLSIKNLGPHHDIAQSPPPRIAL